MKNSVKCEKIQNKCFTVSLSILGESNYVISLRCLRVSSKICTSFWNQSSNNKQYFKMETRKTSSKIILLLFYLLN